MNDDKINKEAFEKADDNLLSEQDLLEKIDEALSIPIPGLTDDSDAETVDIVTTDDGIVEYEYSSEAKKKLHILLVVTVFITVVIILGLGYHTSISSMILDMINDNRPQANVEILSVPGSNGGNDFICYNDTTTYIYTDGAIIDIDTNEILVKNDNITNIACNNNALIYSTDNILYRYDFKTCITSKVGKFNVISMKGNSDDVFVTVESGKSGIDQTSVYNVLYFHSSDPGIQLDKLIDMQYEQTTFGEYTILINKMLMQICYITDGEFEYTCGSDIHGLSSYGICRIDENFDYIFPNNDARRKLVEITGGIEYAKGLYTSKIGFINDTIYLIEQYGRYNIEHIENIKASYKDYDAYFSVDSRSGNCKLLYKCKSNEQLVGFSTLGNEIYILRDEAIYAHNLDTGQEEYVFYNKGYGTLLFEVVDDTMYIFDRNNYSGDIHYITRMKVGKRRYVGD